MKTLQEIASENHFECIKRIAENTRLTTIAEITKDKNSLLKLRFQKTNLMKELEYHRAKLNEE